MTFSPLWKKVKAGKCWHVFNLLERYSEKPKLLGFIRCHGNGAWDAYIVTTKRWPEAERRVTMRSTATFNASSYWNCRAAVEAELRRMAERER